MTWGFGETEIAAMSSQFQEVGEIQVRKEFELPDDSGETKYKQDLPDDSGDSPGPTDLSNEKIREVKIRKQDELIQEVQSGKRVLTDTLEKGNFGEMLMDQILRNEGYIRISKEMVTDLDSSTHQGIDGVYYNPQTDHYIIADAKYNTAQLEQTQDGKQMSESWIDSRLDAAVGKEKADEIREAMLDDKVDYFVVRVGIGDNANAPAVFEKLNSEANIISKGDEIHA